MYQAKKVSGDVFLC